MASAEDLAKAAEAEWLAAWRRGPSRTRWRTLPVQVGDDAPDLSLEDERGRAVRLADVWRSRPALLLFWRHFGCGCGIERGKRLQDEFAGYAAAGLNVLVIGQGEPDRALAYRERFAIPVPILCDPQRRAYHAYGLLEGTPAQLLYDAPDAMQRCDPEAGVAFAEQRRRLGRPPVDSPWQLPGEFVVASDGTIRVAWRYNHCEDFPDPRVHIAAARAATGALRAAPRGA